MANFIERAKILDLKSSDQELDDIFNLSYEGWSAKGFEISMEKIKLIYQIREIRNQAKINRRLVWATWALVLATWALGIVQILYH